MNHYNGTSIDKQLLTSTANNVEYATYQSYSCKIFSFFEKNCMLKLLLILLYT